MHGWVCAYGVTSHARRHEIVAFYTSVRARGPFEEPADAIMATVGDQKNHPMSCLLSCGDYTARRFPPRKGLP